MKINKKYEPLWTTKKRYIVIYGGRGSAKSFAVNVFLNQLLLEKGHNILFTRYTLRSAEISIIPEFREKTHLLNIQDKINFTQSVVTCTNGNILYFRGIKTSEGIQTASLKSIPNLTTWVMDEAEELPTKDIFDTIDNSIRKIGAQNRVILVLNPSNKASWIYKEFFEKKRDDVEYIHTTYLDNIDNLSQSFIDKANETRLKDIDAYNNIYLGEWANLAKGLIYNYNVVDCDTIQDNNVVYGFDFGYSSSYMALVKCNIVGEQVYISQLLYVRGKIISELLPDLFRLIPNKNHEIWCDSARPESIEELYKVGFNAKSYGKGAGSIVDGIAAVKKYILNIDYNSLDLLNEIKQYRWKEDKNGNTIEEPIKDFDHLCDAFRMAIHSVEREKFKGKILSTGYEVPKSKQIRRVY